MGCAGPGAGAGARSRGGPAATPWRCCSSGRSPPRVLTVPSRGERQPPALQLQALVPAACSLGARGAPSWGTGEPRSCDPLDPRVTGLHAPPEHAACGIQFPDSGLNPGPLAWRLAGLSYALAFPLDLGLEVLSMRL